MCSGFERKGWKFVHGHVKFETSVGHPRRDVEDTVEYMSLEFRKRYRLEINTRKSLINKWY